MDTSFANRRPAASHLPDFRLPPPLPANGEVATMHNRYPAYAPSSTTQPTAATQGHVLTPPAGLPGDGLSPLASSVNSGSSGSSGAGAPPYHPMGFWPTPQNANSSYNYTSGPPMPAAFTAQHQQQQSYMGRPMYSPSMNYANRNTNSPSTGDGNPGPPYEISLPSFPTPMSSGSGQQQNLPTLAPQHQQQQQQAAQQHHQQQQAQQAHQQHQQMMNAQQSSQAPPQQALHAQDNYGGRAPPTPASYYTPASTPQQASFPAYAQQSPQESPITSQAPPNRISPVSAQGHPSMGAPQSYHARSYPGYNLPAMSGPILSNVHSPGGQMALVGGMNMQYPTHPMGTQMYPHHPGQQPPQNDRPFKCDQCPQSFNRNHDLKRHKRIHLAVKPFPCGHCEKSFSRKDALKRHILVKGCGKPTANGTTGQSDDNKDSSVSNRSPELPKKEI